MTTSIRVYDLDNPSNELSFESSVGFFDAITRAAATFGKAEAVVVGISDGDEVDLGYPPEDTSLEEVISATGAKDFGVRQVAGGA